MKQTLTLITALLFAGCVFGQSPIKVEQSGEGNPILFLPGFTSPGSVWDETIDNIPESYKTFVVSYAGFNGLEPIGTPWYKAIKQQLIDFINKEKLSGLTIIGHSMGGNLATELAAELTEKVTGLILVDAVPCMRELMMPGVPVETLQYNSPQNKQMLNMSDEQFRQLAMNTARNMASNQSDIEEIASWSVAADRETYVYGYTDLLKLDLRPTLAEIRTKTLILAATFPSRSAVEPTMKKQYANLKNKTIVFAENSKHFIMLDQPNWFYEQINNYLANNAQ